MLVISDASLGTIKLDNETNRKHVRISVENGQSGEIKALRHCSQIGALLDNITEKNSINFTLNACYLFFWLARLSCQKL